MTFQSESSLFFSLAARVEAFVVSININFSVTREYAFSKTAAATMVEQYIFVMLRGGYRLLLCDLFELLLNS